MKDENVLFMILVGVIIGVILMMIPKGRTAGNSRASVSDSFKASTEAYTTCERNVSEQYGNCVEKVGAVMPYREMCKIIADLRWAECKRKRAAKEGYESQKE